MEIICTSRPKALPRNQISYIWKSDPEYLGTLLPTRKLPHIKGFKSALYHYINHKPYPSWGTWILPNSCTLKFLEILLSLTKLSEGLWPVSHRCPLIGFSFFFLQVHPLACVWTINSLTIFIHHQFASSVGTSDKPYRRFKDKELYGFIWSMATTNQETGNSPYALERQV